MSQDGDDEGVEILGPREAEERRYLYEQQTAYLAQGTFPAHRDPVASLDDAADGVESFGGVDGVDADDSDDSDAVDAARGLDGGGGAEAPYAQPPWEPPPYAQSPEQYAQTVAEFFEAQRAGTRGQHADPVSQDAAGARYPIPPQYQYPDALQNAEAGPSPDAAPYPETQSHPEAGQHAEGQPYPDGWQYPAQQHPEVQQPYGSPAYPQPGTAVAPAQHAMPLAQYGSPPVQGQYTPSAGAPAPYAATDAPGAPLQPPPIPAPEDLLVPTKLDLTVEPASWGWRGRINRATGGLVKAKAAQAEVDARNAIKRIQRSFSRPMTVVVVQPKGGAGKTPTTVCLAAAFGAHRGGYVVGWDDNETRGTLAVRVANPDSQQSTVWDLLSDLAAFERYDARVGDLSYYVRAQPDAHFDALVSDDNPANMAQIGEEAFQRLHTVLQRFYRVIVVDTGNNVRSPNWQAAVNAADLVVAVSTYQRDVGYSASWVLDHLAQTGREELARNAVTVLTAAEPSTDREVQTQLVQHFGARTRAVVEIPYDKEIAHGGPIRWANLTKATRNAWVEAGATVVDALSEHDQRTLAARRT